MDKIFADLAVEAVKHLSPVEFVRSLRGGKIRRLREALQCESLSPCARKLLEEKLNSTLVLENIQVTADLVKRQKICELVEKANGELDMEHVARADSKLRMRAGKLIADVSSAAEKTLTAMNWGGGVFLIFGAPLLCSPLYYLATAHEMVLATILPSMALGLFLQLIGIFLLAQPDDIRIALLLRPQLDQLQMSTAEQRPCAS